MHGEGRMDARIVSSCIVALFHVSVSTAQIFVSDSLVTPLRDRQLELPGDAYVPFRGIHQTSPAYRISTVGFLAVQVNVDSAGNNILGDAANEPSLAIAPTNPNRMAIGWRQFAAVTSNFRQAGYGFTTNRGLTWRFPGVIQPGVFRSDPVLDSDSDGIIHYNSLTLVGSNYSCSVFRSSDGGATWDAGVPARGGDKQWMAIDKTNSPGQGNIYAYWTSSFSICPPGFFTRSTDHGGSYESCVVIPQDPRWGTLDVGPDGELYVCGTGFNSFVVAKSTTARNAGSAVSWDTVTAVNLDGTMAGFVGSSPNPGGLLGQAWVAVDRSNGTSRGNVYVLCSVQRSSTPDPLDVMFARSTNGGLTWSVPIRVNDDANTTAWQWFGTMSVAPTGRLDVVWLDTRDNPGGVNSSLYYSYSMNAGVTWSQNVRLSGSFNPHVGWPQQNKMGDYFHMVSDSLGAHLAWAATFNGEQDVYYGHISFPLVSVDEGGDENVPTLFSLSQNYPNPFNPVTNFKFSIVNSQLTILKVYDMLGREVAILVNEMKQAGSHEVGWDATGMSSGVYFYRLSTPGFVKTRKLVLLR